jgi:hypothetical protein
MSKVSAGFSILAMMIALGAYAADEVVTAPAGKSGTTHQFDTHIDSWVEGTIITLDADGAKFGVRGTLMPYASAYSSMQKEIAAETADLDANKRNERTAEIRAKWQDRLNNARNEKAKEASDYTFATPAKGKLTVMDEKSAKADFLQAAVDARKEQPIATAAGKTDEWTDAGERKEAAAMMTLKDLKIGDRVKVGYDDGIITNEAYTVLKSGMGQKAEAPKDATK